LAGPCARNGSLPFRASAPVTAGVSWAPRRGTSSACATKQSHAPIERHLQKSARSTRGHVLHSVQEPVLVNRHSTAPVKAVAGDARSEVSRSGKPGQLGGTGTEVSFIGRSAARRTSRLSQGSVPRRVEKRKEVAASVPARRREFRLECPHVAKQFAEVVKVASGLE
jgi:hypothetical protein